MKLLKAIGSATWFMTKAGLLYGALLGGLFGVAIAILSSVGSPYINDASELINYCVLTGLFGTVFGGVVGLIAGVIDALMLVVLTRMLLHKASEVDERRELIAGANALLSGVAAFITLTELFGIGVISGDGQWRDSAVFFGMAAFVTSGAFWRITRNYIDRVTWTNASV